VIIFWAVALLIPGIAAASQGYVIVTAILNVIFCVLLLQDWKRMGAVEDHLHARNRELKQLREDFDLLQKGKSKVRPRELKAEVSREGYSEDEIQRSYRYFNDLRDGDLKVADVELLATRGDVAAGRALAMYEDWQ
jgi:hypothetical protein